MTEESKHFLLKPGSTYHSVHFSGCGFMLPYFMGIVTALRHFNIKFDTASGSSGGVMAALAILGASDLNLGIRQCFDLRFLESATVPGSIRSFFQVYRQYFRSYRSKEYQKRVPIESLKGRLLVRLGRWNGCWWEVYLVSDFTSEQDLEDAFMSAAYIPFGTSVLPPFFRGELSLDATLTDYFVKDAGTFCVTNPTLWPTGPIKSGVEDVKMVCMPTPWSCKKANNFIAITGGFRKILDFWASRERMERGFVEGYKHMVDRIDVRLPMTNIAGYQDPRKYLEVVQAKYENWKSDLGYIKTENTFECDPIAVPAIIFAMMVCGFKPDIYTGVFLTIVFLLTATAVCLHNRPKVNCGEKELHIFEIEYCNSRMLTKSTVGRRSST